jgi:alpha-beta hydrolase superfamily lysophospholipase
VRRCEGTLQTSGGLTLFERAWLPDTPPRAAVVIVHGYAEHSGRYDHVGAFLASRGYAAFACDLRGHGRSDGPRALVRSFNEYLDDVDALLASARRHAPAVPLFILGHSMGGAVLALHAIARRPDVAGLLFSGAALRGRRSVPAPVATLFRIAGRLFPSLPLVKLDATAVSRDPAVVEAYVSDPLVYHGRMKAGLMGAGIRAGRATRRHLGRITAPLLALHGSEDTLALPEGSRDLVEGAASADKQLRIYDGLYHEILNEPEQGQILDDIAAWLDARSDAPSK